MFGHMTQDASHAKPRLWLRLTMIALLASVAGLVVVTLDRKSVV